MLLRLSLTLVLVVLLALPASAAASSTQSMTFEAPRELLDPGTRDRTLQEIREFGVDRVRVLVYWQDFAPSPKSKTRPRFDATDPNAYPAGAWDRLDGLFTAAAARGIGVQLTLTGPVPRWATSTKRDNVTKPSPKEFRPSRPRSGAATATGSASGRSGTSPTTRSSSAAVRQEKAKSPRIYRNLFLAGQRGLAASGNGADTLLFGETAPRGTPRVVAPLAFLRGALCLTKLLQAQGQCARINADGYAHHAYTTRVGPRFRRRTPTT